MLSRLCKLCHGKVDISLVNLRRYRVTSTLLEQNDDEENTVPKTNERIPIILAKRPSWNFYRGKVFGKFETIPLASQAWQNPKSIGDYFTIHPLRNPENEYAVPEEPRSFVDSGLHPKLIENLRENNIGVPTDIQVGAIPKITEGCHTILSSETGRGKTLAYLLPIFDHILKWKTIKEYRDRRPNHPFGIIVTPSRELSLQIAKEAEKLLKDLDIDVKVITGTRARAKMLNPSIRNVDLLIGTFGILSKMVSARVYKLDFVKHVVLDEAHALFHETFDEKLEIFLRKMPFHRGILNDDPETPGGAQLTLVSATKPSVMPEYLNSILDIQALENIATDNFHRVMVPQKFMRLALPDKPMALLKMVKPKALKHHRIMVFSNSSSTCDWISLFFNEFNIRTVSLNGNIPLAHRKGKFMMFQRGDVNVISTTNAGARGLDATNVNMVLNYDFPLETADYIHRCGRTGRLGSTTNGRVVNFVSRPFEIELTKKIERAARRMRPIPILNMVEENAIRKAREDPDILAKPSRKSRTSRQSRKPRRKSPRHKKKNVRIASV